MFLATLRNEGRSPILILREQLGAGNDSVGKAEMNGMVVYTVKVCGDKGAEKRYEKMLKGTLEKVKVTNDIIYATHLDHLSFLNRHKVRKVRLFYDVSENSVPFKEFKISFISILSHIALRFNEQRLAKKVGVYGVSLDGSMQYSREKYKKGCSSASVVLTTPATAQTGEEEDIAKAAKNLAGKRVVVAVGDYSEWDDLSYALDVASNVVTCYDDVFFLFVGKTGLDRDALKETINGRSLNGRLAFLDGLSYGKIMAYLENSHVGLALQSTGKESYSESAIRLFSYMQAGLPIVAPSEGIGVQVVRDSDCGMLVDITSSVDVAGAVTYLLTHPEKAKASGTKGKEAFNDKYCWEKEQKKLIALFGT